MSYYGPLRGPKNKKQKMMSSRSISVSKVLEDAGETITCNYLFKHPRVCPGVKASHWDKLLRKEKKLNYLNLTTSGAAGVLGSGVGSNYNSLHGKCKYYALGNLTITDFLALEGLFDDSYPNLSTAVQDTLRTAVYLHSYNSSMTFLNAGNTAINIELYDVSSRHNQTNWADAAVAIEDNSQEYAQSAAGYNQNTFGAFVAGTTKIAVNDDDYHWSLNHAFCSNYKVHQTRRVKLAVGATLKINIVQQLRQMVTQQDLSTLSFKSYQGAHQVVFRMIGQMCLGGAINTSTIVPNYAPTAMAWYSRIVRSGNTVGQSILPAMSAYGKVTNDDTATDLHVFDEEGSTDAILVQNV